MSEVLASVGKSELVGRSEERAPRLQEWDVKGEPVVSQGSCRLWVAAEVPPPSNWWWVLLANGPRPWEEELSEEGRGRGPQDLLGSLVSFC